MHAAIRARRDASYARHTKWRASVRINVGACLLASDLVVSTPHSFYPFHPSISASDLGSTARRNGGSTSRCFSPSLPLTSSGLPPIPDIVHGILNLASCRVCNALNPES